MRRLVILAFIPFLSFWMIATGGGAGASPSLSGAWLFGNTRPEPKESVVSIPQRCWEGGVDFTLSEKGGTLTGTARWIQAASGVARPSRDETEALTGRRDGNHVVLTGKHTVVTAAPPYPTPDPPEAPVTYDLRLDPKTGHLVGTRNGQPLWLARFKVRAADCGSPPP